MLMECQQVETCYRIYSIKRRVLIEACLVYKPGSFKINAHVIGAKNDSFTSLVSYTRLV